MSRYPNRIPSRPSRPVQENKPTERASDLFKDYGDKNSTPRTNTTTCDDYIRNLSVKNTYGIQTSNYHRQEQEKPLATFMNSGLSTCKVITLTQDIEVSVSACNRIKAIEIYNQSLLYADCTKLEEVTDNSKYDIHKRNGYKVYDLYKYNFVANADTVHMTIAVR